MKKITFAFGLMLGGFVAVAASVLINRHCPGLVSKEIQRFMLIFGTVITLAGLGARIGIWLGE